MGDGGAGDFNAVSLELLIDSDAESRDGCASFMSASVSVLFCCCSTTGESCLGGDSAFTGDANDLCDVGVRVRPGGGVTANVRGCCCNRFDDDGVVGD